MRHVVLALWLVAISPGLGARAPGPQDAQQSGQVGDFIFVRPAGWRQLVQNGNVFLIAPPANPGTATIITMATDPIDTDLPTSFNKEWQNVQKLYRIEEGGRITPGRISSGYPLLSKTATGLDATGRKWALSFNVIQYGQRAEIIISTTDDFQPQALAANEQALQTLLASLRFRGPQAVPEVGLANPGRTSLPANPGRLSGIYRAASQNADPLDMTDPSVKTPGYRYLTFFPDGKVKKGLPLSGLDGFVEESEARLNGSGVPTGNGTLAYVWGYYRLSGDRGQIQFMRNMNFGRQVDSVWNIQQYPDRLEIQGDKYIPLDRGDGLKLKGTYKPFGDIKQKGITFTPDGEFVDEGILNYGAMAIGTYGPASGTGVAIGFEAPNGGRGMYRIANYTLTLQYGNSSPSALFYVEPGASKDDAEVVYINNIKFKRLK